MAGSDPDLPEAMGAALADTFMFYLEAHIFHWNVTGPRFSQLHGLFGEIYEDAFEAVDGIAERIRALNVLTPMTAKALMEPAKVLVDASLTDADEMVARLLADNEIVATCLK